MEDPKSDPRDYVIDIASLRREDAVSSQSGKAEGRKGEEVLSIMFKCCNVYAKIRITADQRAFAGHCPKCARAVRVEIDPNSTNTGRFFTAE